MYLDDPDEPRTPILPFEMSALIERFGELVGDQEELSRLLGEANRQSSETWHDNAPGDAINSASHVVSSEARAIQQKIREAITIEYPDETREATLGSLVFVKLRSGAGPRPVYITGVTRDANKIPPIGIPDDALVVTIKSPLARALLGAAEGETVHYETPSGDTKSVAVGDVIQLLP